MDAFLDALPYLALALVLAAIVRTTFGVGRGRQAAPTAWVRGEASADALNDAPSGDEVYLEVCRRTLDAQVATSDTLDTKGAGLVATGATVLPLTFGLLGLSGREVPVGAAWLLGTAGAAYGLVLACGGGASRIRALEYRPDLATLRDYSQQIDGAALRRWVSEEYAASVALNRPKLARKARLTGWANVALYVEAALLTVAGGATLLVPHA